MCGIVGYVGGKETADAADVLLAGLRTLEYRGYDSAGLCVAGPEGGTVKSVGDIAALHTALTNRDTALSGSSGIAHTRWATHGIPSEDNAHPHHDMTEKLWLVHNGIIENYQTIKEGLLAQGLTFYSDTDTEVLTKLIGVHYQGDLLAAVRTALLQVRGTYGIAVIHTDAPDVVVTARLGSPIVLGVRDDAHYIASDPSALLPYTKRMVYLEDGDIAVVRADSYQIETMAGEAPERTLEMLEGDSEAVQKDGYEHFMLKEIMEGPQVVKDTLRGRLLKDGAKLGGLEPVLPELTKLTRLTITACGTASYAGLVGKYLLETYARVPVEWELASEYRYKTNLPDAHQALLAITQSGETADTLAAIREAKRLNLLTLGVVNAVGSTIARETDAGVYNHAGPEIAVASTKAFISQLVVMNLITLLVGRAKGMSTETGTAIVTALESLPDILTQVLEQADTIQALAERYANYNHAMFIGRNTHVPIAYEGALKLKEVSYIHAEAYAAGELKHGPIALLEETFPVIALAPQDATYEKMISNIEEVKARQAPILAIGTTGDLQLAGLADDVILVPKVHEAVQPIVSVIPLHLFAYYVGVSKGLNVDRPRNLAKSVTVE